MKNRSTGILIFIVCIFLAGAVRAAGKNIEQYPFNPEPDPKTDILLPMPGDAEIVFRSVEVPGPEFWGNTERLVLMGDAAGEFEDSIFEPVQKIPVFGSFLGSGSENWVYWLAKYELTVGQYIAVMGDGDESRGLTHLYETCNDKVLIKALKKAIKGKNKQKKYKLLGRPIAWVGWHDIREFIHRYNTWCFDNEACADKMPRLPDSLDKAPTTDCLPGFFRLPTEQEWEYAARGGVEALRKMVDGRPAFEKALPFPKEAIGKYAWTKRKSKGKGPTRIGRFSDTFGFHDLFGNVQELTSNLFVSEMIQGKVGALSARGGSYLTGETEMRSSLRSEVSIYKRVRGKIADSGAPTTGFRLAIGSLVIPSPRFRDEIKKQYEAYEKELFKKTPAGVSIMDSTVKGGEELKSVISRFKEVFTASTGKHKEEIRFLKKALSGAEREIQKGIRDACTFKVRVALESQSDVVFHYRNIRKWKKFIEKNEGKSALQKAVKNMKRRLVEAKRMHDAGISTYIDVMKRLGGSPKKYVYDEIRKMRMKHARDSRYIAGMNLFVEHFEKASRGMLKTESWLRDIRKLAEHVYKDG